MIFQIIIDSLGLGLFYALLTIGVALLFGILGLLNFAYGEIIMVAAAAILLTRDYPWYLSLAIAAVTGIGIAVATERIAFRKLRNADPVVLMITSFAVSIAIQSIARMTVLPRVRGVRPYPFLTRQVSVAGVNISVLQIMTLVVCLVMIGGLVFLLRGTRLGIQLRAAAEDFDMAKLLGIRASTVIISAFVITGFIAAVSAYIIVVRQGAVSAEMGLHPLLIGVVGTVVGGMRNLGGAALGGFIMGFASTWLEFLLPTDLVAFRDAFLYALVILILMVRPNGIFSGAMIRQA